MPGSTAVNPKAPGIEADVQDENAPRSAFGLGSAYAAALIIQRGVGFALLPLYTRYLSTAEYGLIAIATAVSLGMTFLLAFGLETAVIRFWFTLAPTPSRRTAWLHDVSSFMCIAPLAGATLALAALALAPGTIFGLSDEACALAIATGTLTAMLNAVPFALLRAQERLGDFIRLSVVLTVANASATVLFVVVLGWGVNGWLLGTTLACMLTLITAVHTLPWRRPAAVNPRRGDLRLSLAFGLPLLPHLIALWSMQGADRIVLGGFVSDSDVGVYALAANLAAPVLIIASGVSQGTMPSYGRIHDRLAEDHGLGDLMVRHVAIVASLGLLAAISIPIGIEAIFPSAYAPAAGPAPILVTAFTLAGLYFVPMNLISITFGHTRWIWTATVSAALLNIGLLFLLIPEWGIDGAAAAVAASFFTLLVAVTAVAVRLSAGRIEFHWGLAAWMTAAAIAAYALYRVIEPSGLGAQVAVALGVALVGIGAIWAPSLRQMRAALP